MKRLAYALLAVCWIAGIWIWLHPTAAVAPPQPLERGAQESAPARPVTALEKPLKPQSPGSAAHANQRRPLRDPAVPTALLRVRSSVGLPLLEVEVSIAGEDWVRVELPASGLEIEPDAYPLRVRAAGHVETDAPRGAQELALEPDALLTIEAPHLRTAIHDLRVLRRPELEIGGSDDLRCENERRAGLLAEFPDADHLLVAFSPARLAHDFPGDVDVAFECPGGQRASLSVHALPGLRANWQLPAGDAGACAPLEVEIEGTSPASHFLNLRLCVLGAPAPAGERLDFAWGSATIAQGVPGSFPDPLWGKPGTAHLDALALGVHYLLRGCDSEQDFGSLEFVHDGSARKLTLQAPWRVTGRVVDAATHAALVLPDLRCGPVSATLADAWSAHEPGFGEDGAFEVRLPDDWQRAESDGFAFEPVGLFRLDVSAAGHRSVRREFEFGGKRTLDLGEIALPQNPRPLLVAIDELAPPSGSDFGALSFGDEPALEWSVRHSVARGDGDLELELETSPEGSGAEPLVPCRDLASAANSARPFVRAPGELLLLSHAGQAFALKRAERERYHVLPRRVHQVEIQCERFSEWGAWTLGWRGGGTWARFRVVNVTSRRSERIALPELATELWWSAGEAPAELCGRPGGSLALDGTAQTIVLR